MKPRFWRKKWFIASVIIIVLTAASLWLLSLKLQYDRENDQVLEYFSKQSGMADAFAKLGNLTPPGSVVLCWWDYGRAVRQWSHREAIEAYPSRDVWNSVGTSRTFLGNLEAQLFGTWGSSEKIHDLAAIFMRPEDQALSIMRKYNVTYALIFIPDELQKFVWIAQIAGYTNSTQFLTYNKDNDTYSPTAIGAQTTLLRLAFDRPLHPQYFEKLYDNGRAKIFRVKYY
jgi:hypothetical protein